ncbi:MAG: oligosaccharide flippase family protein [Bacteroidales bacterium]|nr:oligosaccharide flippase family protein [Bacteroidales bacterium]
MIKKILAKISGSEFNKNSLTLISGTTIAQLLPIAVSPILTRIYTPEDFGVLALFMSLSMILSIVATGRYELAILLPKKDSHGFNLLALSIILAGIFSVILMIALFFFHDFFVDLLDNPKIGGWLYLLPIVVFFLSGYNALNYFHTRFKNYKILAKYRILRSGVMSVFQIGLFFLHNGILALVSGYSLAQLSGNTAMMREALKNKELRKSVSKVKIIALAKKYSNFPKSTLFANLLNKGSSEMPNILITPIFNSSILGFYSLGYRLLAVPSTFIGGSLSQVFMQAANEEIIKTGKSNIIFKSVFKKLLLIGIPFFTILALTAEPVFGFVFGKEWTVAGTYAMYMSPLLFTRFVVSTLSVVLYVFEKHAIILFIQITMFILSVGIFLSAFIFKLDIQNFLLLYSLILTAFYLIYLFILWKAANAKL